VVSERMEKGRRDGPLGVGSQAGETVHFPGRGLTQQGKGKGVGQKKGKRY